MQVSPANRDTTIWHTCSYCYEVRLRKHRKGIEGTNIPTTQALDGALQGCAFFKWLLRQSELHMEIDIQEKSVVLTESQASITRSKISVEDANELVRGRAFVLEAECEEQHIWVGEQSPSNRRIDCDELVMIRLPQHPMCTHLENIDDQPPKLDGASDEMLQLARTWLEKCQSTHEDCIRPSSSIAPSRLVHIGTDGLPIRLHNVDAPDSRLPYAALSYCWGGPQTFATTRAILQHYQNEIPLHRLGKTLQDACSVTLKLGLRYLWVDSLCIIQDDEDDKAHEISKMADIYCEAEVCISASRAKSSGDGFLQDRRSMEKDCQQNLFRLQYFCDENDVEDIAGSNVVLAAPSDWWDAPRPQPIDHRAWTFQEHLLPNRILRFCDRQLVWTCNTMKISDGGFIPADDDPAAIDRLLPLLDREPCDLIEHWADIVNTFTQRKLSYSSDKLRAIAAIAEAYGRLFKGGKYLAGLWDAEGVDLGNQLLWEPEGQPEGVPGPYRPAEYRAPSWSWASVEGGIGLSTHVGTSSVCEILGCEVQLEHGAASYGAVKPGTKLLLRSAMQKGKWLKHRGVLQSHGGPPSDETRAPKRRKFSSEVPFDPDDQSESQTERDDKKTTDEQEVWCLKIGRYDDDGTCTGLVVKSAAEGQFVRLGVFYELSDFVGEERTIELV